MTNENDHSHLIEIDWLTLNSQHSIYADKQGYACVYKDGYGQYGALSEYSKQAYKDLASIVKPERIVLILGSGEPVEYPEWKQLTTFLGYGMILESPIRAPELDYVQLSVSDAAKMVELGKTSGLSVQPRSIELGNFYGIKKNGDLVAMAGEGMKIDGYTEVADVRTHPDFRKRGYGGGLTQVVCQLIQEKGDTPCLRVRAENTGAIRLYEKLGFIKFLTANYDVLMRTNQYLRE